LEQGTEALDNRTRIGLCSVAPAKVGCGGVTVETVCDMCHSVVKAVEEAMRSTMVEAGVAAIVADVCTFLPAPISTICHSVARQYVLLITQRLEQSLETPDISTRIGLGGSAGGGA